MRTLTLSQRLFLVTAVAILPTVTILMFNLLAMRTNAERQLHDEARETAHIATLEVNRIVSGIENTLRAVASAPVLRAGDSVRCAEYLARVVEGVEGLASLAVSNADGQVQCMSSFAPTLPKIADRDYFQVARSHGDSIAIGTFVIGRGSGKPALPIALPLDPDGSWAGGVIAAELDLAWLGNRIEERNFAGGNALTIADRNGKILAREPFPEDFVGTAIPDQFLRLVTADAPGTEEVVSQDGTERVIGYVPASPATNFLYVSAGLATGPIHAETTRLTLIGAGIGLAGILSAFLMAGITSDYFIRRPFRRLVGTIEAWQHGDPDRRTNLGAELAEFGRAGRALDAFMDQLVSARKERRAAERQREVLVKELNHRVKNIVATVQAIARQTFRGKGQDDAVRVFNDRLRAIGAAHDLLLHDHWQSAAITDLVAEAIKVFDDPGARRFNVSGENIDVGAKAAMTLVMALHELCTNAAKYGALSIPGGEVAIRWYVDVANDEPSFNLAWTESNGPKVEEPAARGFGSAMIEQVLAEQLGGTVSMEFHASGLICRAKAPLKNVVGEQSEGLSAA